MFIIINSIGNNLLYKLFFESDINLYSFIQNNFSLWFYVIAITNSEMKGIFHRVVYYLYLYPELSSAKNINGIYSIDIASNENKKAIYPLLNLYKRYRYLNRNLSVNFNYITKDNYFIQAIDDWRIEDFNPSEITIYDTIEHNNNKFNIVNNNNRPSSASQIPLSTQLTTITPSNSSLVTSSNKILSNTQSSSILRPNSASSNNIDSNKITKLIKKSINNIESRVGLKLFARKDLFLREINIRKYANFK
jgi:hypothetical protein